MIHPPRHRRTAVATAAGTLVVTLTLLAGMPYVLWRATGVPWPEPVSSLGELARQLGQPVSDPLMIKLLAMVGWVCWAAFTCSVVRESIWYTAHLPQLLRDRHTHRDHLATLSAKGAVAALCVGTLVVALLVLWRPGNVNAQQSPSPGDIRSPYATAAAHGAAPGDRPGSPAPTTASLTRIATTGFEGAGSGAPTAVEAARQIEYTVVDGDTLWDIARTHMGDPLKWPRIYALNKDRVQSDGSRLGDPDLITPGWQLTVPSTRPRPPAPAPARTEPTPKPTRTSPSTPAPLPANPASGPDQNRHNDTDHRSDTEHASAEAHHRHDSTPRTADTGTGQPTAVDLGEAGLIGITAAAGLLAARRYWYRHHTRLRERGQEDGIPALSPLVDKAAQAAHAANRPRPSQDDDPAIVSPRLSPPAPRSRGTVTIGTRGDAEVPLEELASVGGSTWVGPGSEDAARALLVGVLTAAERRRPEPPLVKAVVPRNVVDTLLPGLPATFAAMVQSTDVEQAVQVVEQHLIAAVRAQDEQDTALAAAESWSTEPPARTDPGLLLLLTAPAAAHTGQLQTLAARSRPGTLIVLTLGTPLPDSRIWHIASDGTATDSNAAPQHLDPVKLFHITQQAAQDVTEVLLTAHGHGLAPEPPALPASGPLASEEQPGAAAASATNASRRTHRADAPRRGQGRPVRLHVLGPISLYARDHQDPIGTHLRGEVREFLALLAAHPTGLLASDIAEKLNIDLTTDQNALKNLRRAVRRALRAATGITAPEFILRQGELHKLHPDLVETDLADFNQSLKEAFPDSGEKENQAHVLSAVRDALAHYRGPFAQGSDFLWADAIRAHLAIQATEAALRVARQAERTGAGTAERDAVLVLLEDLSAHHPDHERLVQHSIRLYQAAGRHDAARHTYTRLERHLAELGLKPEPATQALVAATRNTRTPR